MYCWECNAMGNGLYRDGMVRNGLMQNGMLETKRETERLGVVWNRAVGTVRASGAAEGG